MQGRCVWTDERGDKVYSELKGELVGTGKRIVGTFLEGTGRFAGVTGEYSFQWQYVVESEDGAVSGRAVDLKGRARFGSTAARHWRRTIQMSTATTSLPHLLNEPFRWHWRSAFGSRRYQPG